MIPRMIQHEVRRSVLARESFYLRGAPSVGKTALVREVLGTLPHVYCSGWSAESRLLLYRFVEGRPHYGGMDRVVFDNSEWLELSIHQIHRHLREFPRVQFIYVGVGELTVQGSELPIKTHRLSQFSWVELGGELECRLVWGMHPTGPREVRVPWKVRKEARLAKLVRVLAMELGRELTLRGLGERVGVDKATVGRYLGLLESAGLVHSFPSVAKPGDAGQYRRVFFQDNGIRNAALQDWRPRCEREDAEALWMNFLVAERLKVRPDTKRCFDRNGVLFERHGEEWLGFGLNEAASHAHYRVSPENFEWFLRWEGHLFQNCQAASAWSRSMSAPLRVIAPRSDARRRNWLSGGL